MLHGGGGSGAHGLGDALSVGKKNKKYLRHMLVKSAPDFLTTNIIIRRIFSTRCRLLFSKSWPLLEALFLHKL